MRLEKVDFENTNQFSKIFTDYIGNASQLRPFFGKSPSLDSFELQIKEKQLSAAHRKILSQVLTEQYRALSPDQAVIKNIESLSDNNTFTVTTGHQLNIFTGPLYFIYKIVSVINTCKQLKAAYPDYEFVPVYWMASEDHDFDEISYFRLNGKKIQWKTDQTGAVGRMKPKELKSILDSTPGIPKFFKDAYLKQDTLADAVRAYVNHLFESEGLVVLDADDAQLKGLFADIIKDDLISHKANDLVNSQSQKLDESGFKSQVFPREINFFYLKDELRERIVEEKGKYRVLETDIEFTSEEIEKELAQHPERFSPNVIMRPLYQEVILPNLAYFGGPGELAYWFQLKSTFDHYSIPFPILMPRNFALIIPEHIQRKMKKAGCDHLDVFTPKHALMKQLALAHANEEIELNGQKKDILSLFEKIKTQAASIDPTLAPHVEAQQTKTAHTLEAIEKKFIRAEKKKQADRMRQTEEVLDYLFPGGVLQERTDNFLNFYLLNENFVRDLLDIFDPFDLSFNVILHGE